MEQAKTTGYSSEKGNNEAASQPPAPAAQTTARRSHDFVREAYPDKQFQSDEQYEEALMEYLNHTKAKLSDNEAANEAIAEILFDYPEFAEIIEDMKNGVPVRVALARHFDPDDMTINDDEQDADKYKEAVANRKKRKADADARIKEREANLELSEKEFDDFMEQCGWDDEKTENFAGWIQEFINDFARGLIKKPVLLKLKQAYEYEEAVEEARQDGEIEGRNSKIEAERVRKSQSTDGLPKGGGAASATTGEQTPKPRKIIDIDALKENNL